jgi:hypothetical protein
MVVPPSCLPPNLAVPPRPSIYARFPTLASGAGPSHGDGRPAPRRSSEALQPLPSRRASHAERHRSPGGRTGGGQLPPGCSGARAGGVVGQWTRSSTQATTLPPSGGARRRPRGVDAGSGELASAGRRVHRSAGPAWSAQAPGSNPAGASSCSGFSPSGEPGAICARAGPILVRRSRRRGTRHAGGTHASTVGRLGPGSLTFVQPPRSVAVLGQQAASAAHEDGERPGRGADPEPLAPAVSGSYGRDRFTTCNRYSLDS